MGIVSPRAKSIRSDASNRWRCLATVFLAIALSMPVSCGGGNGGKASDTKSPQRGDAATPTPDARAQAAADEAILTLEDFPSGWVEIEPSDSDTDSADPCYTEELHSRMVARTEWKRFGRDNDRVSNNVSVFASESQADETITAYVDRVKSCDPSAMQPYLGLPEGQALKDMKTVIVPFTKLADRSEAWMVTVTISHKDLSGVEGAFEFPYQTFVLIRSGRMVSTVFVWADHPNATFHFLEEMARLSLPKLEAAAQLLP